MKKEIHQTVVYGGENGLTMEHLEQMLSGELTWEEAHKIAPGDNLFIEVLEEEKEEEFLVGTHAYDYDTIIHAIVEDTWHRLKGPLGLGRNLAEQMRARQWAAEQVARHCLRLEQKKKWS